MDLKKIRLLIWESPFNTTLALTKTQIIDFQIINKKTPYYISLISIAFFL